MGEDRGFEKRPMWGRIMNIIMQKSRIPEYYYIPQARDVLQAITEGKNKGFSVDSVMPYNIYLRCLIGNVTASLEGLFCTCTDVM